MVRWLLGGALVLSTAFLFVGCNEPVEQLCTPGDEIFCKCRGGDAGTKTCQADGNSFAECVTNEGSCPEISETTSTEPVLLCIPNEEVPCACDGSGDPGLKTCSSDGMAWGDCTTSAGSCGTSTTGDKLLYATCASGNECQTGVCDGGYCTRSCEEFTVCNDAANDIYGDCVAFDGGAKTQCAPYCIAQSDCAGFGAESQCGGAAALDDPTNIVFAVCANWGEDISGMPYGTPCEISTEGITSVYYIDAILEMECRIGLDGVQNVCLFSECTKACEVDLDCPNLDCSSTSGYGCCLSDPECDA